MAAGGPQKALDRFRRTIEGGAYYEAQQVLKTVYHRNRARKQLQDSYRLLAGGAVIQLEHGQVTCGAELAQLLIEAYMTDSVAVSDATLQPVLDTIDAFCKAGGAAAAAAAGKDAATDSEGASPVDQCARLGIAAVKWVVKLGSARDAQKLHDKLAQAAWRMEGWRSLAGATPHFIRGSSMEPFARAVHEAAGAGGASEEALFVCRAVLQLLATPGGPKSFPQGEQAARAADFLEEYEALCGTRGLPQAPAATFAALAVEAVRAGPRGAPLYRMLMDTYSGPAALGRDPALLALAQRVQATYFPTPGGGGMGPFGGLLGSMLGNMLSMEGE